MDTVIQITEDDQAIKMRVASSGAFVDMSKTLPDAQGSDNMNGNKRNGELADCKTGLMQTH